MQRQIFSDETRLKLSGNFSDIAKGDCYRDGRMVKADLAIARRYYIKAAKKNNSSAFLRLANLAKHENNVGEEQYFLGRYYILLKNWRKAKETFEKGAAIFNVQCMNELGALYLEDRFNDLEKIIEKDKQLAISWFITSARQFDAQAINTLTTMGEKDAYFAYEYARILEDGTLGSHQVEKAIQWYLSAATQLNHHPQALGEIERLHDLLTEKDLLITLAIHDDLYAKEQAIKRKEEIQYFIIKTIKRLHDLNSSAVVKERDADCYYQIAKLYEEESHAPGIEPALARKLIQNAIKFYYISAQKKNSKGLMALDSLFSYMTDEQLLDVAKLHVNDFKNYYKAAKYFKILIDKDNLEASEIAEKIASTNIYFANEMGLIFLKSNRNLVIKYYRFAVSNDYQIFLGFIPENDALICLMTLLGNNDAKTIAYVESGQNIELIRKLAHGYLSYHVLREAIKYFLLLAQKKPDSANDVIKILEEKFKLDDFDAKSAFDFGVLYENQNNISALVLYKIAADLNHAEAMVKLENLTRNNSLYAFKVAQLYASQVFPNVDSMLRTDNMKRYYGFITSNYEEYIRSGEIVREKAMHYYFQAAELGHEESFAFIKNYYRHLDSSGWLKLSHLAKNKFNQITSFLLFLRLAADAKNNEAIKELDAITNNNSDYAFEIAKLYDEDLKSLKEENIEKSNYYNASRWKYYLLSARLGNKTALELVESKLSSLTNSQKLELARIYRFTYQYLIKSMHILKELSDKSINEALNEIQNYAENDAEFAFQMAELYRQDFDKQEVSISHTIHFYLLSAKKKHEKSYKVLSDLKTHFNEDNLIEFTLIDCNIFNNSGNTLSNLKSLADSGNVKAIAALNEITKNPSHAFELANLYLSEDEKVEAVTYLLFAAEFGNDKALATLEADTVYSLLDQRSLYKLGDIYLESSRINDALKLFKSLSVLKNSNAIARLAGLSQRPEIAFELGNLYASDEDNDPDKNQAIQYYLSAALSKHAGALNALIALANDGNVEAQFTLGAKYFYPNNEESALYWCLLAFDQHHEPAIKFIHNAKFVDSTLLFNQASQFENNHEGVEPHLGNAFLFYKKAAENKHVESLYRLGCLYQVSNTEYHLKRDINKSFEILLKAAELGSAPAIHALDSIVRQVDPTRVNQLARLHQNLKNELKAAFYFDMANKSQISSASKVKFYTNKSMPVKFFDIGGNSLPSLNSSDINPNSNNIIITPASQSTTKKH